MARKNLKDLVLSQFANHRIVFWDDEDGKNLHKFEELDLEAEGIVKILVANNEFMLKYRMLIEEPSRKFLVYREHGAPKDGENWLLDLQLSSGAFSADAIALILNELELPVPVFREFVEAHRGFFEDVKLCAKLKKYIAQADEESVESLSLKMLGVLSPCGRYETFETILMSLFEAQYAEDYERKERTLDLFDDAYVENIVEKYFPQDKGALAEIFYAKLEAEYGYERKDQISKPITDFVHQLFRDYLANFTGEQKRLNQNSELFFNNWKQHKKYSENFGQWASIEQDHLQLTNLLDNKISVETAVDLDCFPTVDLFLIQKYLVGIMQGQVHAVELLKIDDVRRDKFYYEKYELYWQVLINASRLKDGVEGGNSQFSTLAQAVNEYSDKLCHIDEYYRLFSVAVKKISSTSNGLFTELKKHIDYLYSHDFLVPLAQKFSALFATTQKWSSDGTITMQKNFFKTEVLPALVKRGGKSSKIAVIISDGLRYELGKKLCAEMNTTNRREATIRPMLSVIPSYTQLGMAALLPNDELALSENGEDTVFVDGINATGIKNREKILSRAGFRSICVSAEDLEQKTAKELRESLVKDHDVIYIYHNVIDQVGEHNDKELFEGCDKCLESLQLLIKKLFSANLNNLLVTADHGFICMDRTFDLNTDFISAPAIKNSVCLQKQRFIVTPSPSGVNDQNNVVFASENAGLKAGLDIITPSTLVRYSRQGASSNYFHGGLSLEECVVPLIKIYNVRADNVKDVDVILLTPSQMITTAQISLKFAQMQPIGDGIRPVKLKIAFYSSKDSQTPCSSVIEKEFSSVGKEPSDLEYSATFLFNSNVEEGSVYLRMERISAERSDPEPYGQITEFMHRKPLFERDDFDF